MHESWPDRPIKDYDVATFSVPIIAGFAISIVGQFIALALIPATRGFIAVWPTLGCILCFIGSLWVSARLVHAGVELSILTPIITVALQIFVLVVGITIYGESASLTKIGLLVCSAVMIAAATRF
jgi:small multidrug resistance pump